MSPQINIPAIAPTTVIDAIKAVVLKSELPDRSTKAVSANTVSRVQKNKYNNTCPAINDKATKQKATILAMRFFASVPTIYLLRLPLLGVDVVVVLDVDVVLGVVVVLGEVVVLGGVDVLGFDTVGVGSLYSAVEREEPHTIHSVSSSSLYVPQFLQFQPNCISPLSNKPSNYFLTTKRSSFNLSTVINRCSPDGLTST